MMRVLSILAGAFAITAAAAIGPALAAASTTAVPVLVDPVRAGGFAGGFHGGFHPPFHGGFHHYHRYAPGIILDQPIYPDACPYPYSGFDYYPYCAIP